MRKSFTNALAVCAAVSCFAVGAYTVAKGLDTISGDKIRSVIAISAGTNSVVQPATADLLLNDGNKSQ